MATIQNYRDNQLQATSPRVVALGSDYINLTSPYQFFRVTNSTPNVSSITINASLVGTLRGTVTFSVISGTATITTSGNNCTLQYANMTSDSVTIQASLTQLGLTYTARYTITKVLDGSSPIVYSIYTSSPVITKDAADAATTGTYTSITIQGKKYDGTLTTNYGYITVTANDDTEATTATNVSSTPYTLSPTSTSGKSSFTIKLYNQATVSGATLLDTQTVNVVYRGVNGTSGTRTAILDVYQWSATAPTTFPVGTSTYTWATGQFTAPATLNGWTLTPGTPTAGQTLWIARTIYADSGSASTTSIVTWSASTAVPTGAAGANGAPGANGQRVGFLEVYKWSDTAPTTFPSGTSTYTWATGAFTAPSTANGWSLTPGAAVAGQTLWGISVSVSDALTTATSSANWNSNSVYAVGAAGTNGTNGTNGTRTAILDVYQWSATQPSTFPIGTSQYNWSTGQFSAPATLNNWTLTPSAAVTGQTLWIARTVYADTNTSTVTDIAWNATIARPLSASGAAGANGQRVGFLEVYQWSATAPTTYPAGTSTYTWATGAFTAPTTANGWSLTPGAAVAGQTLWGISVSVSDALTTPNSTANWNSNSVYAVGAAGTNGTNGANSVQAILSNESHVFPANSTGVIPTAGYTGSGTEIRVYDGATLLNYNASGTTAGTWNVTVTTNTNITAGTKSSGGTASPYYAVYGAHSTVADATDTSSIVYTITGKTLANTSFSIVKTQTFSKSKAGNDAITIDLISDTDVVPANAAGTSYTLPTAINKIRLFKGGVILTSGVTYSISNSPQGGLTASAGADGTITLGGTWTTESAQFTCNAVYNSITYSITYTITKAKAGTTGNPGVGYGGLTSSTSTAIGTGAKSFTVSKIPTDSAFTVGQRIRIASTASPTNYMEGIITSYSLYTMGVTVDLISGSGTYASWSIGITGNQGTLGNTGPRGSITLSGATTTAGIWVHADANNIFTNAGYLTKVVGDICTLTSTNWTETRYWNGNAWTAVTQVLDGSLLITGSIGTTKIAANAITAASGIIQNAAIETLKIAGNAVTVPSYFSYIGDVNYIGNEYKELITGTITTSGYQPLVVSFTAGIGGANTTGGNHNLDPTDCLIDVEIRQIILNKYGPYTATAGQTTFLATYTPGYVNVYINGVMQSPLTYKATNGNYIIFNTIPGAGKIIEIYAYTVGTAIASKPVLNVTSLAGVMISTAGSCMFTPGEVPAGNYRVVLKAKLIQTIDSIRIFGLQARYPSITVLETKR